MAVDINKIADSNTEWAAQQLTEALSKRELKLLRDLIEKVDLALYKSWAKDMPLREFTESVNMAL